MRHVEVSPYPHRVGGHCGSGALRDLLQWRGLGWSGPLSEALVYTLAGSHDLSYVRSSSLTPPIYLVGRGGDLEIDLPHRLGATVSIKETDDPDEGWDWLRDEIDAGRPALIWADIAELPYLRTQLSMSRHDVVVTGYDDATSTVSVVDNDRTEVQRVPYDAMRRARSSRGFPQETRHRMYLVEWPGQLPSLADVAASAFKASGESMRAVSPKSQILPPTLSGASHGLAAVSEFSEDIWTWKGLSSEELEINLFSLWAFIEKAGTGGSLFRRLLADGAAEVARATDCVAALALSSAARQCAYAWSEVAGFAASRDVPAATRVARAAVSARDLPRLETRLCELLETTAESLKPR